MKPKSGKKIEAVKPVKPEEAFVADEADPGKVAKVKAKQVDAQKGKYGQTKTPAFKPKEASPSAKDNKSSEKSSQKEEEKKTTFISIKLTDEKGNAVVGEKFEVELPDGSVSKGTLDIDGSAKVEGFEAGPCKVRFPNLEDDSVSAK
jgi:hypothetical protein